MKITFQNSPDMINESVNASQRNLAGQQSKNLQSSSTAGAFRVDFGAGGQDRMIAGMGKNAGVSSMAQLQQAAENMDATVLQNYMTVMSNTMSEEDYAKLERDGFSFRQMDPEEVVTIVDKIKAELAKAGTRVAGYNDDLDTATLEAALGSQVLAQAVSDSFREMDLPLSADNIQGIQKAWELAFSLEQPTAGTYQYLLKDELAPEIWNLYLAQSSGAGVGSHNAAMFYAEDVQGYYTQAAGGKMSQDSATELQGQIDRVIEQAGLEVTEESRKDAAWILGQKIPLTPEKLRLYQEIREIQFPVTEEAFAKAAAQALLQGREAVYGNLSGEGQRNLYQKAQELMEAYWGEDDNATQQISDRRMLEEVRLHMTTEVNLKLLRSGFSIDTAPMEELVEALKAAEKQVAEQYFPGDAHAVDKYENYQETSRILKEIPGLPAAVLGSLRITSTQSGIELDGELTTMSEMYNHGRELQHTFEAARESYETLMTAPRADMGDSIRKAFANVDDILKDLGLNLSEENQKAVRVLGYNRMELSKENISRVREAQLLTQEVVTKMTPASVLKMIRDGVNPLEKNFEELQDYLNALPADDDREAETYSRFLWRMEKSGDITPEERESFIGIYRMLHQIEKKDGAAVGMVLNTGAELQFGNLLTAARSLRAGSSMDVRLTDQEEKYLRMVQGDNAIDQQIDRAYRRQELEEIRSVAHVSKDAQALLEKGEMPLSADNLLAAEGLTQDEMIPFGKVNTALSGEQNDVEEKVSPLDQMLGLWEELEGPETFQAKYSRAIEEFKEQIREEMWQRETSMDVRNLRLLGKQLSIMGAVSQKEEYYLPLEVDGQVAKLHLTIESGRDQKGKVSVETETAEGKMQAEFYFQDGKISGILKGNGRQEVMKLQAAADIFNNYLRDESSFGMDAKLSVVDVASAAEHAQMVIRSRNTAEIIPGTTERAAGAQEQVQTGTPELYRLAKLWIRAVSQKEAGYEN